MAIPFLRAVPLAAMIALAALPGCDKQTSTSGDPTIDGIRQPKLPEPDLSILQGPKGGAPVPARTIPASIPAATTTAPATTSVAPESAPATGPESMPAAASEPATAASAPASAPATATAPAGG
ncbi:MAG TPA: hypothetical protein VHM90_14795 [Phycisphaerae bacterium]|nr:hypothetical protein [Phycisphaerae bacterium]